jgi:hypothetical protein
MVARSWAMGTASTVWARPCANSWRATALDVLEVPAVHARDAGEPGVEGVDEVGQAGLPLAGRHGQAGDRHPVAQPHRRVAGEEQVGQRVDHEVVVGQQAGHQ